MRTSFILIALLALLGTSTPVSGAEAAAANMEFVTSVPFEGATHLEFLVQDGQTYAVAGSRDVAGSGVYIVNVTDPENPVMTSHVVCSNGGNADIGLFPEVGLLVFTVDTNGADASGCFQPRRDGYQVFSTKNIIFVDITDLSAPELIGSPRWTDGLSGIHTIVRHPTRSIAYLSDQETPHPRSGPLLKMLDLEDIDPSSSTPLADQIVARNRITTVGVPPVGSGPHDTTFSPDGERAYVSAVTASYILDTTDPLAPSLVSIIVNPAINIHHEAMLSPDDRYLFIVDELGGAAIAPQCPGGGVHVYDLGPDLDGDGHGDLEAAPIEVGVFFADDLRTIATRIVEESKLDPVCTAHEGNFSADGSLFSVAWYEAGSRLFDTSMFVGQDLPPGTRVLASEAGFSRRASVVDNWASKIHPTAPEYIVATNQEPGVGGLDIFRIDPSLL